MARFDVAGGIRRAAIAGVLAALLSGCWLQIGGNAGRTYHNGADESITPENVHMLSEDWSVELNGATEPLVRGDRLYLGSWPSDGPLTVYALGTGSGEMVWETEVTQAQGSDRLVSSAPVFSGGDLVVNFVALTDSGPVAGLTRIDPSDGSVISTESELVAVPLVSGSGVASYFTTDQLVVRDAETAEELWTADSDLEARGVLIADDRLHLRSSDRIRSYDVAGCAEPPCPPSWATEPLDDDVRILAAAATSSGDVVFSTSDVWRDDLGYPVRQHHWSRVQLREGATGSPAWQGRLRSATGRLALTDDSVLVGSREILDWDTGDPLGTNGLVSFPLAGCDDSTTYCSPEWEVRFDETPGQPVSGGGGVIFIRADGALQALDADGCGAQVCEPIATFEDAGSPQSLALGRLYTTQVTESGSVRLSAYSVDEVEEVE